MFSLLTTTYLFLGGVGGGSLTVLSLLETKNASKRFSSADRGDLRTLGDGRMSAARFGAGGLENDCADGQGSEALRSVRALFTCSVALPGGFFARAWSLCLVALATGALCLLADLGRADRALRLLLSPAPSIMTVGAWALLAAVVCAALFFALAVLDGFSVRPCAVRLLAGVGGVVGVVVVLYTGVLLQGIASVLLWQTWLLPAVFGLSSLSCGVACVLLVALFADGRDVCGVEPLRFAAIDSLLLVLETLCLVAYAVWAIGVSGAQGSVAALSSGQLAVAFWGGVVVCGLLLPFVLESLARSGALGARQALLCAALLVLVGGAALRFVAVAAGGFDVTQMSDAVFGMALREGVLL